MMTRTLTSLMNRWLTKRLEQRMAHAASTSAQQRVQRWRRITSAVLVFFVIVMLMEVVILPGSMIRRHLHSPAPASMTVPGLAPADSRQEQAPAALCIDYERLNALIAEAEKRSGDFQREVNCRLSIDITASALAPLPLASQSDPVAANAWADIRKTMPDVIKKISAGREVARGMTDRLRTGKWQESDKQTVRDAADSLQDAKRSLERMVAEFEHIRFARTVEPR
jgi:hypothetical protein